MGNAPATRRYAAVDGGPQPANGGSTFTAHLARMAGFGLLIMAAATVVSLIWAAPLGSRPVPGVAAQCGRLAPSWASLGWRAVQGRPCASQARSPPATADRRSFAADRGA